MSELTTRLRLPRPTGGDPADVPSDLRALTERLDAVTLAYDQGPLANRPTTASRGQTWYDTDSGILYFHDGSRWRLTTGDTPTYVVGSAGAPAFGSGWRSSTLGAGPVRYWKVGTRVHLAGMAQTVPGQPLGSMFTLPVGYRPNWSVRIGVAVTGPNENPPYAEMEPVFVMTNGTFVPGDSIWVGTQLVDLEGASFDIAR